MSRTVRPPYELHQVGRYFQRRPLLRLHEVRHPVDGLGIAGIVSIESWPIFKNAKDMVRSKSPDFHDGVEYFVRRRPLLDHNGGALLSQLDRVVPVVPEDGHHDERDAVKDGLDDAVRSALVI